MVQVYDSSVIAILCATNFSRDLSKLHAANDAYLNEGPNAMCKEDRDRHLEEVYILAECEFLKREPIVKKAIAERGLKIHGFVFDKEKSACVRLVEQ
jgi:carbonic anhydrase